MRGFRLFAGCVVNEGERFGFHLFFLRENDSVSVDCGFENLIVLGGWVDENIFAINR